MSMDEFTGPPGTAPCGHSLHHANLATSFKVHFAPVEELKKYRGVCKSCFQKFRKLNAGALAGEIETPVEFSQMHTLNPEQDHAAYDRDMAPGQIVDFDWASIEGAVENEPSNVHREAAELLSRLMVWIWRKDAPIRSAMIKFTALTAAIRPDLLGDRSYLSIGQELGVSKAAISRVALKFEQAFNIKSPRSRSPEARAAMRRSQLGHVGYKKAGIKRAA